MASFWLDLRHTLRGLRSSLTFTTVTVLVLAIGIGSNTAMFSLVRNVLIKPLPFEQTERLVWLIESVPSIGLAMFPFSAPDYEDLAESSQTLEAVGAFQTRESELTFGESPETVRVARVTAGLFDLLGFEASLGRAFAHEEDVPRAGVVLISYELWQRLGGSSDVIGRRIDLDRVPHTVIGVLPRSATFPLRKMPLHGEPAQVFVPMGFTELELANRGMMHNLGVIGRLAPESSLESAQSEMVGLGHRIYLQYPGASESDPSDFTIKAESLRSVVVGDVEKPLLLLLAAMLLVMLVVCANVANLTFSRSLARRGEMAVRTALGATRRRILQIFLLESLLLAALGGALGVLITWATLQLAEPLLQQTVPMADRVGVDPMVVLFVIGLSLIVACLFGSAPLLSKGLATSGLSGASGRGTAARGERRVLRGIAVVTLVVAVVLLVGAGLLLRSFDRLMQLDPGFDQGGTLTMSVALPNQAYPAANGVLRFAERLQEELGAVAGVDQAAVSSALPMEIRERRRVTPDAPAVDDLVQSVNVTWASPNFFETYGIPLTAGRPFTSFDRADGAMVVVVSEALGQLYWPGEDVLGRRLAWMMNQDGSPAFAEIVGVVGAVNDGPLGSAPAPHLYVPLAQFNQQELDMALQTDSPWGRVFRVGVRSNASDPTTLAQASVAGVHRLDSSLAVSEIRPLDEILQGGVASRRISATMVTGFALTALLLAAIGLYGVLAYSADQRKREFGLRLALGAPSSSLVKMVVLQGLTLSAIGLGAGLILALTFSRLISSVLYQISPTDPVTMALVAVALLGVAGLASLVPAWRAGRVDPIKTLRQ